MSFSPSEIEAAPQRWAGCDLLVVSPTPTHPQDHGNRKRIYEICTELKRQGARIHFVHYAAEHDWRTGHPRAAEREMIAAWDSYQLVAPSRPVHHDSLGPDHLIDEWADPDIGHYVAWACRTQPIDAVIVNYTWMSFVFDYVPEGIFKICDTHDAFGGRRDMLERNGIAPEFFHTTEAEEAKGLARADLVWAIKDGERRYFTDRLALPNCLTMLHAEPDRAWWNAPPSSDSWLRAGVIGARNNVNRRNLERFLEIALPLIESYLAEVKIVIAGSCAEDFKHLKHRNVEIVGRVPDIAEFYRSVDVVIAPMEFSTGLKIKVSEALAAGAPLLALAHATEGYPTGEPMHLLPDFRAMAMAMVKLAFDPSALATLAARSRAVCADIRSSVAAALAETRRQLIGHRENALCVVVPMAALDARSLLHDHLTAVIDYFRRNARLSLYVVGPPAKAEPDLAARFGEQIKVFAAPGLMAELGAGAPEGWAALSFADLVETWGVRQAYFMAADGQVLAALGELRRVIVRQDAIELAGGDPAALIDAAAGSARIIIASGAIARAMAWRSHYGVDAIAQIGFRRTGRFQSLEAAAPTLRAPALVVLGSERDPLARQIAELAARIGARAAIVDPDALRGAPAAEGVDSVTRARLVVDLAPAGSLAAVLSEAAQRAGIPVVRLMRGRAAAAALPASLSPLLAASVGRLLRTVARALADREFYETLAKASRKDLSARSTADAGWTWLWERLGPAGRSGRDNAAAGLFG